LLGHLWLKAAASFILKLAQEEIIMFENIKMMAINFLINFLFIIIRKVFKNVTEWREKINKKIPPNSQLCLYICFVELGSLAEELVQLG